MSALKTFFVLAGATVLAGISSADWVFGSGRSFGMAGAGLAVPYDFQHSAQLNPAIYGLGTGDVKFTFPKLGLKLQGISYGDLSNVLSSLGNGGVSSSTVPKLAQIVGGQNTEFGLDANVGLALEGLGIDVSGGGTVNGIPDQQLATYVNTGGTLNNIPNNATQFRFDGYGVANYDIAVAYGRRLKVGEGDDGLSLGARAHFIRTYYSHYMLNQGSLFNNPNASAVPAEDMGGNSVLSQNGFGLDVGAIFSTGKTQGFFVGGVVQNLIVPNVSFGSVSPTSAQNAATGGGGAAVVDSVVNPYARQLNLGVGYMSKKDFVVAADLYDFFGGANRQLRAGLEWNFGPIAVRGGYATGDGLTYGLGFSGINLAFGPNIPLSLSSAFKF